jgi:hypothetical protein
MSGRGFVLFGVGLGVRPPWVVYSLE